MANQWTRVNLSAAEFPFHTDMWGRSIILPQYDQNYQAQTGIAVDTKDKGVPQAFYMHNVMPTADGYQSIGYDTDVPPLPGATDFDFCYPLQTPGLSRFLFSPAQGKNYVFDESVAMWASTSPLPANSVSANTMVTTAFIHNQTYINYSKFGTYTYDPVLKVMNRVVLVGLVDANVKGVCEANGYMLVWDDLSVSWSNATVETDFVPSLITGAGGGSVNDAKGRIVVCLPISGGFLVYCEKNVVAAKYSGNINFPFIFTEVPGSAGVQSPNQVSWLSNLAAHYAWTSAGLAIINKTEAKDSFPEVTDFLAAKIFEDFDETTLMLIQSFLSTQLNVLVTAVAERFLVISYGVAPPDYTHALVYDISNKRWGKLKITHRACFQWNSPNLAGQITYGQLSGLTYGQLNTTTYGDLLVAINSFELPKKTLAFMQGDGTVKIVNFDLAETLADGVLIIGKFQFQRNYFLTHQNTDIETTYTGNTFNHYLMQSLDGKQLLPPVKSKLLKSGPKSRSYARRLSGQNISHLLIGSFNATSLVMNFTQGGQR